MELICCAVLKCVRKMIKINSLGKNEKTIDSDGKFAHGFSSMGFTQAESLIKEKIIDVHYIINVSQQ